MDIYFHHCVLNGGLIMQEQQKYSIKPYVIGFIFSIILTLLSYWVVESKSYAAGFVIAIIVALAILQLFVQLFFFLHLGEELKPRWRLVTLGFGILVVGIVVFGSLWIMDNLNYNMMHSPEKVETYMEKQGGF